MTRRTLLASAQAAALYAQNSSGIPPALVRATEKGVESLMARQNLDPRSRYRGGIADADELYAHGTVASIVDFLGTCFLHEGSR